MSKPDPADIDAVENISGSSPAATKPAAAIDIEAMAAAMKATMEEQAAKTDDDANAQDVAYTSSKPLTYFNTKAGPFYTKAKQMLQTGDFEATLSKIETGITTVLSLLPSQDDLHPSLAPFYYMYGTTLLYSIEESQDTAEASVMAQGGDDAAGDLQIAWENLESARNILTKISSDGTSASTEEEEERALDLAQIQSRLADLSRHNGHYDQAIRDYESCCETRRNTLQGDKVWDRRIADVEYSLGMTSLLLAAEGEKNLVNQEDDGGDDGDAKKEQRNALMAAMTAAGAAAAPDPDAGEKVNLSPEEISALREKSLRHYVQCARILAGIIGTKTGADSSAMAEADATLENNENKKMASKPSSADDSTASASVQVRASKALSTIRDRVSALKPQDPSDADTIHDLRDMMDEIQETIDNCEQDREGLRDVNKMRKKAEEDIKKADKDEESTGTTTIGFGNASPASDGKIAATSAAEGTTTIGFGSAVGSAFNSTSAAAAASASVGFASSTSASAGTGTLNNGKAASSATAAPMLVVKKKKKKISLAAAPDAKRAKTTE